MSKVSYYDEQINREVTINYEVIGNKEETVVFHHGNGNCIKDWHSLGYVDALQNDFRLVLIDSRGYGESSKFYNPSDYNLKSRASDTIEVLNQEEITTAHCFGGSVGASVCLLLAKYYPERFKSYILATPYFVLFDEGIRKALASGVTEFVAKLEELIGGPIENPAIAATFASNDAKALLAANSSEWFDYLEFAKYIKSPTLIYAGSKEDSLPELQILSDQLNKSSGHRTQFHVFPGYSHAEVYWGGSMVAPVIQKFIQSINEY